MPNFICSIGPFTYAIQCGIQVRIADEEPWLGGNQAIRKEIVFVAM